MSHLFWLSFRLLKEERRLFNTATWVSLGGLVLGVASLVVSMAVVSGFESTLKRSLTDVTGHLQVIKNYGALDASDEFFQKLQSVDDSIVAGLKFVRLEAVLAQAGKVSGVFIQAVEPKNLTKVLNLDRRLLAGSLNLESSTLPKALIGRGIAEQYKLKLGDKFRIVLPLVYDYDPSKFRRKIGSFEVGGILDLGKHEYNQRMLVIDVKEAQELAEIGSKYSGLLLKIKDLEKAREVAVRLDRALGKDLRIFDWRELNESLFEAVRIERPIIFSVILIIVLASAFNVASSLYINVVRKYPQIAILKALGLSRKKLIQLFSMQGFWLGAIGCSVGLLLGTLFCYGFVWLQNSFNIIPGDIYKIDNIEVSIRAVDWLAIIAATFLICFVATLPPALRGSRLGIVEGLRHD